jgi:hypothetical protein
MKQKESMVKSGHRTQINECLWEGTEDVDGFIRPTLVEDSMYDDMWGTCGSEDVDVGLLGYNTMWAYKQIPKFHFSPEDGDSMKRTAFWDMVLCSLTEVDWCFRGAYYRHHQGDETSVYFNKTTQRYISESCHLHTHHHNNLESHMETVCFSETLVSAKTTWHYDTEVHITSVWWYICKI